MIKKILIVSFVTVFVPLILLIIPCSATTIPVDLTVFYTEGPVSFGPNINDAVLSEDFFGSTLLSNDPFLGDIGIYIPADATTLSMNLAFSTSGSDNFGVKVLDPSGGAPFFDFFYDQGSEIFNDFSIDLAGLSLQDTLIGLEFGLGFNLDDDSFDALLEISKVNINLAAPIPEPATILLLTGGILGLGVFWRKKIRS